MLFSKKNSLLISILAVICVILICITVFINRIDQMSVNNTDLFKSTVSNVEVLGKDNTRHIAIKTDDFSNYFIISSNICNNTDIEKFLSIDCGDNISIRVLSSKSEQINKVEFVDAVFIEVEGVEVLTLNEYNQIMKTISTPTFIVFIIFSAISCLVFIITLLVCIKRHISKRHIVDK